MPLPHRNVRSPPRTRAELSRNLILSAALRLIDTAGLDALNMRDLGVALGAATMSVYRHFRNKAELLDAVVDHVVTEFAPEAPLQDWQAEARAMSTRVRAAMLAHPELADLIGRELRRSPTSLRVNVAIIERLRAGGVPEALLPHAYWALSSYTTGFALLEAQALRRRASTGSPSSLQDRRRKIAALLKDIEGLSTGSLHAAADVLARPLDDEQFLFGLDCVIRGLAQTFGESKATQVETEI